MTDAAPARLLAIARREIAEAGVTTPLEAGSRSGRDAGGLAWVVHVTPYGGGGSTEGGFTRDAPAVTAHWIEVVVSWRDWYGPRRIVLSTVKLGGIDLAR